MERVHLHPTTASLTVGHCMARDTIRCPGMARSRVTASLNLNSFLPVVFPSPCYHSTPRFLRDSKHVGFDTVVRMAPGTESATPKSTVAGCGRALAGRQARHACTGASWYPASKKSPAFWPANCGNMPLARALFRARLCFQLSLSWFVLACSHLVWAMRSSSLGLRWPAWQLTGREAVKKQGRYVEISICQRAIVILTWFLPL